MGAHHWRYGLGFHYVSSFPGNWLATQKKTLIAAERDPWQRAVFQAQIAEQYADALVVLDEGATNLNFTRRYARAPRGKRAYGVVPRNTPVNTTLITCLTRRGIGPSLMLQGSVDTHAFEGYVEYVLMPSLRPGQIVLRDNASAHKSQRVRDLIEACGCRVWYLPPYSPDFSPIELAISKLKSGLRARAPRTLEALEAAISETLETITADDATGYFTHSGYQCLSQVGQLFYNPL
jgi:transposase